MWTASQEQLQCASNQHSRTTVAGVVDLLSGLPRLSSDGSASREFVLFFSVIDEGSSLYLARNIANFLPALAGGTTVIMETSTDEAIGV